MHDCQFKSRLSAYHDAELTAAEIEAVNEHLPTCATCSAELAALREVSSALSSYQPDEIRQIELARLHRAIDRVANEDTAGVLRLAGMLSALAASVFIICMTWMSQPAVQPTGSIGIGSTQPAHMEEWEKLARGGQPQPPGFPPDPSAPRDSGFADAQTINFMLDGTQGMSGHEGR